MGQLNSFIEPRPNGANYGGYTYGLRRLYISKFKKPLLGRTGRGPTNTQWRKVKQIVSTMHCIAMICLLDRRLYIGGEEKGTTF